ncbi:MAG: transposase [Desulfobacterales bacterium]|nr:transposase [Desulfobacterales bacterium]
MPIIIQTQFDSAVVDAHQDLFTRSYIEGKNTVIEFDMRKRDYEKQLKVGRKIYWPEQSYHVDIHEFSTFHNPIIYRFILSQGYYFDDQNNRVYFTPEINEVSTYQHVTKNVVRLACFLAVICGVTLRNIATIFNILFQIPVSKSSIQRWIDEIGNNLPSEEEILKMLVNIKNPRQCHIDGYYPMGTDNCVMVIKDEFDRILITYETESEDCEGAKTFLRKIKELGINIVSAFCDYSNSYIKAIQEVFPEAKIQADHFHTTQNIWKHLKKYLLEYRKTLKSEGEENKDDNMLDIASKLWEMRWILLKKPSNLTEEEKKKIENLEKIDRGGVISKLRGIIKQIVNIFDYSNTEVQAEIKLENLKKQINEIGDSNLNKISKFLTEHWNQAIQYLRKRGFAKDRRSSNSESGMRILRRLEKNHDGIRSSVMRGNYIKIYQAIKYLSLDVADFINRGVQFSNIENDP